MTLAVNWCGDKALGKGHVVKVCQSLSSCLEDFLTNLLFKAECSVNMLSDVEAMKMIGLALQHSSPYDFIVSQARSGAQHSVDAIEIILDKMQEVRSQ